MRVPWLSMPMFIFIVCFLLFVCAVCGKAFVWLCSEKKKTLHYYRVLLNMFSNFKITSTSLNLLTHVFWFSNTGDPEYLVNGCPGLKE